MSGSPQASIDTEFYRIGLFKNFRRAVPAGSDYFEKQHEHFTQLIQSKREEVDAIVTSELSGSGNDLKPFDSEALAEFSSDALLQDNPRAQEMHAVHVRLGITVEQPVSPEVQSVLMEKLFAVFND